MKMFKVFFFLMLALFASLAGATGTTPDYSGITANVDWTTTLAALSLIMGGLGGVYMLLRGGDMILARLRKR